MLLTGVNASLFFFLSGEAYVQPVDLPERLRNVVLRCPGLLLLNGGGVWVIRKGKLGWRVEGKNNDRWYENEF